MPCGVVINVYHVFTVLQINKLKALLIPHAQTRHNIKSINVFKIWQPLAADGITTIYHNGLPLDHGSEI